MGSRSKSGASRPSRSRTSRSSRSSRSRSFGEFREYISQSRRSRPVQVVVDERSTSNRGRGAVCCIIALVLLMIAIIFLALIYPYLFKGESSNTNDLDTVPQSDWKPPFIETFVTTNNERAGPQPSCFRRWIGPILFTTILGVGTYFILNWTNWFPGQVQITEPEAPSDPEPIWQFDEPDPEPTPDLSTPDVCQDQTDGCGRKKHAFRGTWYNWLAPNNEKRMIKQVCTWKDRNGNIQTRENLREATLKDRDMAWIKKAGCTGQWRLSGHERQLLIKNEGAKSMLEACGGQWTGNITEDEYGFVR